MLTYHIAKFDCFKSSRLMMQAGWDTKSVFIQKTKYEASEQTIPLSFGHVLKVARNLGSHDVMIFHAQSALLYLVMVRLLTRIKSHQVIYDIHDLNVIPRAWNYMRIRGLVMYIFEYISMRVMQTPVMIVSKGLAIIIAKRFKVQRPLVVRNISAKLPEKPLVTGRDLKRGVYFGTFDRLPNDFFDHLYQENHSIDIYGRFNHGKPSETMEKAIHDGVVNYCGEYNPGNMEFLEDYDFLYYYVHPYDLNYRFAGPNKFFQALAYGLVLITPPGYSELSNVLSNQPGAHLILKSNLLKLLQNSSIRNQQTMEKIRGLLTELQEESKRNYKKLVNHYE